MSKQKGLTVMKRSLLICAATLFLFSCDDFTNLTPESQRNVEDFYQTESDIRIATNGIYSGFKKIGTYGQNYWVLFEMRSDNTDQGTDVTGLARDLAVINDFEESTTSEFVGNAWIDSYKVIQRANVVLERIDDVEFADQNLKDQLRGEALFLRSLAYYNLAVAFDNIPLVLEETRTANDPINQVQANNVYDQIVGDIAEAEDLLPESYTGSNVGRATKGAAATLLGRVYLTMGEHNSAQPPLDRVVNQYDYELLDDYSDLWGPDVANHEESIFEIQYSTEGAGNGSRYSNDFSPSNLLQTGQGQGRNRPTVDMYEAYEEDDVRRDISMGTEYEDPADGEMVEARFVRKYESDPPSEFNAGNNWYVFRYADAKLMLAEALGESSEAYDLINTVRDRAGLDPIDESTPGSFEDKLLQERRVELAFENHRWADLRRFGVVEEVMQNKGYSPKTLFPIPQREIDSAPDEMEQNPEHR